MESAATRNLLQDGICCNTESAATQTHSPSVCYIVKGVGPDPGPDISPKIRPTNTGSFFSQQPGEPTQTHTDQSMCEAALQRIVGLMV